MDADLADVMAVGLATGTEDEMDADLADMMTAGPANAGTGAEMDADLADLFDAVASGDVGREEKKQMKKKRTRKRGKGHLAKRRWSNAQAPRRMDMDDDSRL